MTTLLNIVSTLYNLVRFYLRFRPLLRATWRMANILVDAVNKRGPGGQYITDQEWQQASAAGYVVYTHAAEQMGWREPPKTAQEILDMKGDTQ